MSDLRARPGEMVDQVLREGQVFLIERKGKPLACLAPVEDFMPAIPSERWQRELAALHDAEELYSVAISEAREIVVRVPELPGEQGIQIEIVLPHGYPNLPPVVRATPIDDSAPHRFPDGSLCVFGMMTRWNPGADSAVSAIAVARQWLSNYHEWRRLGKWPTRAN